MPDAETLRWLIGGGLSALGLILVGVGYIARFAWRAGGTFTHITDKLAHHEKLHEQHTENHTAHELRISALVEKVSRHSGQLEPR